MRIEPAAPEHRGGWARLRAMLWPDETVAEHEAAIADWLSGDGQVAFVARDGDEVVGFAEASVRRDHVNGCDTSPVAFLEGIAVDPDHRRRGIGRALVTAVEDWGRGWGCTELGSDADEENGEGQAMHHALGFEERERVIFYRRLIPPA